MAGGERRQRGQATGAPVCAKLGRSLGAVSAAVALVLVLLRGATSPGGTSTAGDAVESSQEAAMLAAHTDPVERIGDGGYVHD
jgi:hypothetical protein